MEFAGWKMLRNRDFRYIAHADGREFLYDLREPWGEYRDVSDETKYAADLSGMRGLLIRRMIEMERPKKRVWSY